MPDLELPTPNPLGQAEQELLLLRAVHAALGAYLAAIDAALPAPQAKEPRTKVRYSSTERHVLEIITLDYAGDKQTGEILDASFDDLVARCVEGMNPPPEGGRQRRTAENTVKAAIDTLAKRGDLEKHNGRVFFCI